MIEVIKFLLIIPVGIITFWIIFETLIFLLELLYGGAEERQKNKD